MSAHPRLRIYPGRFAAVAVALTFASTLVAGLCQPSLSGGGVELVLLGEQLLYEEENGVSVGSKVVGYYKASNGSTLIIDCDGPRTWVTLGGAA